MSLPTVGFFAPLLAGFIGAAASAPAWQRVLRGPAWVDLPRPERHARRSVSRAGGAAWLSGFLVGGVAYAALHSGTEGRVESGFRESPGAAPVAPLGELAVVAAASILAALLGWLDDRGRLGPGRKWLFQSGLLLAAAAALVVLARPAGLGLSLLLPVLVAIGIGLVLQVALEILDHLDGILAVQAMAAGAALALAAGEGWIAGSSLALVGAAAGFLCWNRPPARLYLGNAGSLALATALPLLLVALAIDPGSRPPDAGPWRFLVLVPAFGWALADLVQVTVARTRRGVPPWQGGRDHLAHRIGRRWGSDRVALLVAALGIGAGFLLAATGLR